MGHTRVAAARSSTTTEGTHAAGMQRCITGGAAITAAAAITTIARASSAVMTAAKTSLILMLPLKRCFQWFLSLDKNQRMQQNAPATALCWTNNLPAIVTLSKLV